ncbi:hypothetical protein [Phytoactinopolyspora halotolerans]|uniref:DUF3352 domain-containing protein n=1 Tax=Phytoactinopolyspora halotolerans TaxID=1981512 RepID=A0A6L9SGW4_9ACTN|nr:hypothetical protein [Phytoactinopolyspora halotolerans]NEE04439.1 hypothetical protein [Phytoactinopolyspora halotolerans]
MARHRVLVLPTLLASAAVSACDSGDSAERMADMVDGLPGGSASVLVLDVAALAEHYELDRDTLGRYPEFIADVTFHQDEVDPPALLAAELAAVIAPFNTPVGNAHLDAIDIGQVEIVVSLPIEGLTVIATGQDPDALGAAYAEAGFDDEGDGSYLNVGGGQSSDIDARYPAVKVDDGLLVLARSPEIRDAYGEGEGLSAPAQTLIDAADDAWAVSVFGEAGMDPATCGAGQAFARGDDGIELLVLGGGEDVVPPDAWDFYAARLGSPEIDGDVTRYAVEPDDGRVNVSMLGSSLEVSRLAEC